MDQPIWVSRAVVLALHEEQLAEHGSRAGPVDKGLLDSALERPRNHLAYNPDASIHQLAACYGFGVARNHPFADGNKRASFVITALFLDLNGFALNTSDEEVVLTWLALAAGKISEEALAAWIGERISGR